MGTSYQQDVWDSSQKAAKQRRDHAQVSLSYMAIIGRLPRYPFISEKQYKSWTGLLSFVHVLSVCPSVSSTVLSQVLSDIIFHRTFVRMIDRRIRWLLTSEGIVLQTRS